MHKYFCAVLLLAGICSGQSSVPFKTTAGGLLLVEAEVNGHKATMVLDTGATDTYVNSHGGPELRQGAHGVEGQVTLVKTDIKIGKMYFSDFTIASSNLDDISKKLGVHVDGIIGQTLLSRLSCVKVDYTHKTIIFE